MSDEAAKLADVLGAEQEAVIVNVPGEAGATTSHSITVRPLRLKQFSEVLKCIDELGDAGVTWTVMSQAEAGDATKGFDTAKLFLRGGDAVIKLLAVATEQELALIQNLDLADAALLAGAVWRINSNFFQKKADTMLAAFGVTPKTAASLKSLLGSLTQSLSSSPAAPSASPTPEN